MNKINKEASPATKPKPFADNSFLDREIKKHRHPLERLRCSPALERTMSNGNSPRKVLLSKNHKTNKNRRAERDHPQKDKQCPRLFVT